MIGESNANGGDVTGNHGQKDCWVVKLAGISVFPNPSSGQLQIRSLTEIDEIKITRASGELVASIKPGSTTTTIKIEEQGIYFVTINSDQRVITRKLIIAD